MTRFLNKMSFRALLLSNAMADNILLVLCEKEQELYITLVRGRQKNCFNDIHVRADQSLHRENWERKLLKTLTTCSRMYLTETLSFNTSGKCYLILCTDGAARGE